MPSKSYSVKVSPNQVIQLSDRTTKGRTPKSRSTGRSSKSKEASPDSLAPKTRKVRAPRGSHKKTESVETLRKRSPCGSGCNKFKQKERDSDSNLSENSSNVKSSHDDTYKLWRGGFTEDQSLRSASLDSSNNKRG